MDSIYPLPPLRFSFLLSLSSSLFAIGSVSTSESAFCLPSAVFVMVDLPTAYGAEEAFRRYMVERQKTNAYLTLVVYAFVLWLLLGAFCCAMEAFFRRRREKRHREEDRQRALRLRLDELHQLLREGIHDD